MMKERSGSQDDEREISSFIFSFFPFILPFVFFHLHAHTQGKENKGLVGETYGV
jgi:hypothetical protein